MIFYGEIRNPKKVYMTESQIAMLSEGVFFTKNQDCANAPIDTRIEPIRYDDMSDSDENNSIADTRFFGTKNNILYGDGTRKGETIPPRVKLKCQDSPNHNSLLSIFHFSLRRTDFTQKILRPR